MFFNEMSLDSFDVWESTGSDGHFDVRTPEKECNTKEKKTKENDSLEKNDFGGLSDLEAGMFSCVSFIKNVH